MVDPPSNNFIVTVTHASTSARVVDARISRHVHRGVDDAGVATTITIWSDGRTGAVTSGKTEAEQNLNRRAVIYVVP